MKFKKNSVRYATTKSKFFIKEVKVNQYKTKKTRRLKYYEGYTVEPLRLMAAFKNIHEETEYENDFGSYGYYYSNGDNGYIVEKSEFFQEIIEYREERREYWKPGDDESYPFGY